MTTGVVSVILPYYNGKKYVREAIESVLAQTFHEFELLLVDDGSSSVADSEYLRELVAEKSDPRIRYLHKKNGGLSDARNVGIDSTTGEFIAFIDQDDIWHPDKLASQVGVFQREPSAWFIFTDGTVFGEEDKRYDLSRRIGISDGIVTDTYGLMLRGNYVIASSAIFRRSAAAQVGYSNRSFVVAPDYEYFIRFAKVMDFYFIDRPLTYYRLHETNTVKMQARLFLEALNVLLVADLRTRRHVALATRHFVKLFVKVGALWVAKMWRFGRPSAS